MWNPNIVPNHFIRNPPAPIKPAPPEREVLRRLAERALAIAREPVMQARKQRWRRQYIYSRKPNPAMICVSFDEAAIRRDIRRTLEIARGCNLEFNMKDTHALQHESRRITRWVQIARDEIEKHWK